MAAFLLGETKTEMKNLPRKERERLLQRREILDAALKLFSEKGYHNVSVHEIAKEAEFGIGTLYKFFANKEELYKALIMEVGEKFHFAFMQVLEQEQDPFQVIKRFIAKRQELFSENLPVMRLYFAETRGASFNVRAGLDRELIKLYDEGLAKLVSVFERGIKEGVFRALEPRHMALTLDGMINAFLYQIITDPVRSREEDGLSTATDIFFRGVLVK
ncbi:TetR/AcrR family transcriptional regulator [Desulfomonile tiedjei]|uniref:Transcriptional regulator n=1 Tax=Desulfomonile tiedjei (strain ATCC 49306 / DSM 6799 / DCB-1) TaxID=706587 RepID=I4C0S6_DESTA|nr:TetR/AcrR family transcriptional regulator [Desulfomonile tiedjei]AFM23167.1 transcriptional regulator [Desulfomonile tiedjei DSM 6799]